MFSRRTVVMGTCAAGIQCALSGDPAVASQAKRKYTKSDVEKLLKTLSNWGRWGNDDELGTINLITPNKRKQAAGLVREGVSVSMAHNAVKRSIDGSTPFEHEVTINNPNGEVGSAGDRYSVFYHGFMHTHMDALCHIFHKGKMYNGFSSATVKKTGAQRLGIDQLKNGVFTKAVLMDLPALFGKRFLSGDTAIYPEHLEAWEKKSGVKIESGDAMLIHTGRWLRYETEGKWDIPNNSAGLHTSCLPWIKDRDISIIGSDLALDVMPSGVAGVELPVHLVVVVGMGMCILDVLDFRGVAEKAKALNRWSFLLTVGPLAVGGGTGSPINPIATF